MDDERLKLPYWIWYTSMFLLRADNARVKTPDKSIGEMYREFLADQNLTPQSGFQLWNQGLMISLAYGMFVLPSEFWKSHGSSNLPPFAFKTRSEFTFIKDNVSAQSQPDKFIQCMRNAIAHANLRVVVPSDIDQQDSWTFWNRNKNGRENFRVQTSSRGFANFFFEVGNYYVDTFRPLLEKRDAGL